MLNQQKVKQLSTHLLRKRLKTPHDWIIASGFLVGFIYSPFWIYRILVQTFNGSVSSVMLAVGALGVYFIWQDRRQLAKLKASEEDRLLGHIIVISGIMLSPLCTFAEWSQRLIWIYILIGIAFSSWGFRFFKLHPISIFLIVMGLFPNLGIFAGTLWRIFTPYEILERFMAWAGSVGLRAIGQPAVVEGKVIALPGGAVEIDWGCSGFSMATIIAAVSVLLGLFYRQRLSKVAGLVIIGIILALLGNVPRIMLMAVAVAYWGDESFRFWHGFWGGQIFTSILITIYYYIAMAIVKGRSTKVKA
ncbi:cyanoexosortase C [Egbenema bharatensis]|uniref:cyanoexosortase C n=1 Tax=Egbenema bharatensis TaxID=3463334 RepID=UPI003A86A01F